VGRCGGPGGWHLGEGGATACRAPRGHGQCTTVVVTMMLMVMMVVMTAMTVMRMMVVVVMMMMRMVVAPPLIFHDPGARPWSDGRWDSKIACDAGVGGDHGIAKM
jgi:hypothetical protein